MNYKVSRRNFKFKYKNKSFHDCIEIEGKGNASFIADTRSGPIIVDIINNEVLCNNIGLVYQKRSEITNASAFGNMELKKYLINQGNLNLTSVSFVIPVFNKAKYLKTVIKSLRQQTGNFDKEYIFINDGSTDNSLEILKEREKI